jgi:hypothetical protein
MKYLGQPQSGSQANTTASHNRAGQYLRSRRTPVTPTRTPKQGILRGKFGAASAAWQSLTSAVQAAWTSFAHAYPVVDALGQSVVLTGQQYFIGIQTSLMNAGQPMNTDIPTNTSTPAVDQPDLYADTNGSVIVSVNSVSGDDFNLVALSKILSNGVNFNKAFSQFAILTNTNLIIDVSAAFAAQFGAPVASRKLFARFKEVNSSGMSGPDLIIQRPVIAPVLTTIPTTTNAESGIIISTATGSGTANQSIWQDLDGSGVFVQVEVQAGVAGVATFNAAGEGFPTFTRLEGDYQYGPPSAVFTTK